MSPLQMLSGIPEVDLGLEAKIRNIEATEEAKQRLLRESMMKKERPSEFVPKNMAVNFVQHNRCKHSKLMVHVSCHHWKVIYISIITKSQGQSFLFVETPHLTFPH